MSLTKLKRMYNLIYKEADKLFKQYNPCQITNGKCISERGCRYKHLCCNDCKYISDNGCTVKSILCKLWTCDYLEDKLPDDFKRRQTRLFNIAAFYGFLRMRGSKKDHLAVCTNSIYIERSVNLADGMSTLTLHSNVVIVIFRRRDIRLDDIPYLPSFGKIAKSDFSQFKKRWIKTEYSFNTAIFRTVY